MTVKEIKKAIKSMSDKEVKEINGYTIRKSGNDYGVRTGDYMEQPYTIYRNQKDLIEAIA